MFKLHNKYFKMKRLLSLLILGLSFQCAFTQLLSWTPAFPTETTDPVGITLDASKGNQALMNYASVNDVYVHTGVITNLSTNPTDWKYVKFNQNFNQPNPALQAVSLGGNKWKFTITGGIRAYYGVTNAAETILKIAILFRNGAGAVVQRNSDGTDMYVPVYGSALAVQFTQPLMQPLFVRQPEPIAKAIGDNLLITGLANRSSAMKIYLNGAVIQTATAATSISANPVLTTAGNQTVVLEANDGISLKSDTFNFFVFGAVTIAPLPVGVRPGINYDANNTSATLVLFAPSKSRVSVIGDLPLSNWTEQAQYQMKKTPDGNYWWITLSGLTQGTEYAYQYLVDGTLKIADPYAEKILDPYNDGTIPATTYPALKPYPTGLTSGIVSVLQTAEPSYSWNSASYTRPDKRNLMIYELLVRDFVAKHDWNTLRDTLNYLKKLGINAIELMPLNEFEGNLSWGYNPNFYFAPDKYYGPKNSLKQFIDSCHNRGIAVLMDIALNHAFGSSPLVQLYADNNGWPTAANPWFNPDQDPATPGYQGKHPFGVGYDFNHESPATNYMFSRITENWLTQYKIDGFRFDLSKGFTQFYSGNNVNLWGQYDASRVAIWKKYYDTLQLKSPGSIAILEHFADNSEEIALSNYGMLLWGNMNYSYAQASMGYSTGWNFEQGIFTARGWTNPNLVTYMESHDEERLMYKNENYGNSAGAYNIKDINTGLARMELCNAFFLTIPGPKMIWQFGELGYDFSINTCGDLTVNNNCRTDNKPIKWDYLQNMQRKRLYDINSKLLKLRVHPLYKDAFVSNRITRDMNNGFKSLQVTTDTSNLTVIGNFDVAASTGNVTFQNSGTWYDYLTGATFNATGSSQSITLQPGEYHVYLNRNLGAVVAPPGVMPDPTGLAISVFPNPVINCRFTIRYAVPASGNITIAIYNATGQYISEIFSGNKVKGNYEMPVNGTNLKLAVGTYYLGLSQDGHTQYVKTIIQR